MIVILDHDENILEFLDDADASVEITDTYGGYKTLDFACELTNVQRDEYLFKQGNKIFLENVLFVINTEVEFDYVDNLISVESEELVSELNNCEPFYIADSRYSRYVSGNTLAITKNVLNVLFDGFYIVDETDLPSVSSNEKLVTVNGTITMYDLLKEIEKATGLTFKYSYSLENNKIVKHVSLLKPENYGVTHNKLLERVIVGENTNKLEYSTDETKNALGIMPIVKSEDSSNVNYSRILKMFNDLDINNERVMPYYNNYSFTKEEIIDSAKKLYGKIELYKFLPDSVRLTHEDTSLDVGMSQFLDLATQVVSDISLTDVPLRVVECPRVVNSTVLDCVFSSDEIVDLAFKIQKHIAKSNECNSNISTSHGLVSFQWLVYIFSEYLQTGKKVVCKSKDYPSLNKTLPDFVEDNVRYIVDTDNFEYMPFMYTQNTGESNKIPYSSPMNPPDTDNLYFDVDNYISESYPELVLTKNAGANNITITVTKQNISQNTPETFFIGFKDVNLIQDNTDITIDFSKKEIKFMKFFETIEEKEVEVTETVQNSNVITTNMMPSCGCCGGKVAYKRYTKTWLNKCPWCGKEGTLTDNPKGVYEGEITCSMKKGGCDADYCGYCGGDKGGYPRCKNKKLTPADATTETTTKKTVQEVKQEYKEVVASDENVGDDETKIRLSDILTENSLLDSFYGDISLKITGATLKSLTCDSTKLYELSPFPYIKEAGKMFIYAPVTAADFNYTHMTNNNPKLEAFETSEQNVEEVLIGCWKKLNGSGDNTAWLDKAEDINVDLTEENLDLNAGDFVYIKLPDTLVFKAQITEKKYDPKIKSDSSLKIGNVTRESIT